MKVTYINLDRSAERREEFLAENSHLSELERFAAVDGAWVDRQALETAGLIRNPLVFSDGAIGALVSHATLWRRAVEQDQIITVAEDDAVFHHSFEETASRLIAEAGDFDMIFWGWNFDAGLVFEMLPGLSYCSSRFDEEAMRRNIGAFQSLSLKPQLFKLMTLFGICCYTITPKGAKRLFAEIIPIRDGTVHFPEQNRSMRNYGIDVILNAHYRGMDAHVCFPPLVVSRNIRATSTIQS